MLSGSSGTRRQCVCRGGAGNQCLLLAGSRRPKRYSQVQIDEAWSRTGIGGRLRISCLEGLADS